ncbi:hypothetical protein QCN32_gp93 [Arthrobacter phage Niktson]|uniref:Uncharacterized protein n=2 Tax=Gordonvirus TaxID=1982152 RepID=A0A218M5P8_9CAUD|nr:hypothetical protein FDH69_gp89 [Arthrobacter phage Gordon]YP_010749923.1 hypothetical protein QCN32_gp93 [Arthrobacter phage Niktson]ALY09064.1 hypothetical protein GORDON_89 [Arthrobacter phage Gordon]ASD52308.1 hypothetical protein NIKTSON_93 [Arthrobacter phage Niktson]ASD52403.1 hypothetical protein ELEPHANTMAN_93 [Arthrobacter phage ElephantMan]
MTVANDVEVMITTTDNPHNPFIEFDEWRRWDEAAGYYTLPYLARVTRSSDELSLSDQELAIEDAINEIVEHNITGMYSIVTQSSEQNSKVD